MRVCALVCACVCMEGAVHGSSEEELFKWGLQGCIGVHMEGLGMGLPGGGNSMKTVAAW